MSINSAITKMLENSLAIDPRNMNIDWFGTMLISGLLDWYELGFVKTKGVALEWFEYHLAHEKALTDAQYNAENAKGTDRIFREYLIPLSTYCGYNGLSFACERLYNITKDERAKQVCADVGDNILHHFGRNNLGLLVHDDNSNSFTIPDVGYYVIPPLFYASTVDNEQGPALKRQATFQLLKFNEIFLSNNEKIAKTVYRNGSVGETYWSRASGWLSWMMVDSLIYINQGSKEFSQTQQAFEQLINNLVKHQDLSGGFHALINEHATPLETTGTSMIAYAIHKAVRSGWIDRKYTDMAKKAWSYVNSKISESGSITGCYSGWALPAEERVMDFDRPMHWVEGMILKTGAEFEK